SSRFIGSPVASSSQTPSSAPTARSAHRTRRRPPPPSTEPSTSIPRPGSRTPHCSARPSARDSAPVTSRAMRSDRLLAALAALLGLALVAVGVIYIALNEHDIPSFFPGHVSHPASHH